MINALSAQSVEDIVEEIQDRYENMKYFSADFTQVEKFNLTAPLSPMGQRSGPGRSSTTRC